MFVGPHRSKNDGCDSISTEMIKNPAIKRLIQKNRLTYVRTSLEFNATSKR